MEVASLPPPLMVSEAGSFAEYTIVHRKPQIINEVISRNDYGADVVARLRDLAEEIATRTVAPVREEAVDADFWRRAWLPWEGKTWRQLRWYFAETYFYRRLLEAVGYFQPGPWRHVDPFGSQKRQILCQGLSELTSFHALLRQDASLEERFVLWLRYSLWGNRADLSNPRVMAQAEGQKERGSGQLLVIDHTKEAWQLLAQGKVRRLDLIADNSGLELLSDLGLLDLLLSHNLVETAHLHLKPQPFFVSDAMPQDLVATLADLQGARSRPLQELGGRLQASRRAGQLVVHTHRFWATCLFFSQFPPDLENTLAEADLLLLKGDVNYRRLLEDRHWPHTASLAMIAAYMPASFLALRTLKGELIVGLPEGKAEELARHDPTWLINGKRGLIHLVQF